MKLLRNSKVAHIGAAATLMSILWGGWLHAQTPSVDDIVRSLRPAAPAANPSTPAAGRPTLRMRGVTIEPASPAEPQEAPSIDLTINFNVNSAQITPDSSTVLDRLGIALRDPTLGNLRFLIAGHTDISGSPGANLRLSKARAESVCDYLVKNHGISPTRLVAEGYGDTRLKDLARPRDPINRRVQIVSIIPSS